MHIEPTELPGVVFLRSRRHEDARGFVSELFRAGSFAAAGLPARFEQDTFARSGAGVVRGLHFQRRPGQDKLVHVLRGAIYDVAVDVRVGSPTRGQHVARVLEEGDSLFVPRGFAHGYAVLGDGADVLYQASAPYDPAEERGVAWDDPALGIAWPLREPVLSDRDRANPRLVDLRDEDAPALPPLANESP